MSKHHYLLLSYLITLSVMLVLVLFTYNKIYPCCYHGGVSSSNDYATQAGIKVLKQGGNAIDAYVAMQAVLTVTEPYASGIGGGAFLMMYNRESGVKAYDAREEAPEDIDVSRRFSDGGASSGVPGTVALMVTVLEKHGSWSLKSCLEPAIELARDGWILDHYGAVKLEENAEGLRRFNNTRAIYFDVNGDPKREGDVIKNPDLAKTFEQLTEDYLQFYNGSIAKNIIDTIKEDFLNPGVMKMKDLNMYRVVEREYISYVYNGYELFTMNMPSSSATIPLALRIFDETNHTSLTAEATRDMFNAMSIAFADRDYYMADADWIDVPLDGLMDPAYARERSKLMTNRAVSNVPPGSPANSEGKGGFSSDDESFLTTQISIIDGKGNVVSCTSTIESTWGNQIVTNNQGFLLNNEMNDFSSTGVNKAEAGKRPRRTAVGKEEKKLLGGKRPRSSMCPTLVFKEGKPLYSFGSPGGWRIIPTVFNSIIYLLKFNMDMEEAIRVPRFTTRNTGVWDVQSDFNKQWLEKLESWGFNNINYLNNYGTGSFNVVKIDAKGNISAATDFRREGSFAVF